MKLFEEHKIEIYNSITGKKEAFKPINEGHIDSTFVAQQVATMFI